MIQIGTSARERDIPLKYELGFAKENEYDLVQVWYKKGSINSLYDNDIVKTIKESPVKIIIHALLDINDILLYGEDLLNKLLLWEHKELIIHPVIKTEEVNKKNNKIFMDRLIDYCKKLGKHGITVYVENNHDHMKTFYELDDWKYFFSKAPSNVEFLIDIVHVLFCNDYDFLRKMVEIKYPKALHIADTIKGMVGPKHLHLPIGDGIVDFDLIFNDILKDFDGLIILEINNTDKNMISSRDKLAEILGKRYKKKS